MQQVIGRTVTDERFRHVLTRDTEHALESYDLTDSEVETIVGMAHSSVIRLGLSTVALRYQRIHKAARAAAFGLIIRQARH
jgi:hypothetical protein